MPFSDLQQQLKWLGYGSPWQQIQQRSALMRQAVNASDLQRIKRHNQQYPDLHRAAKARWAQKRFEEIKTRIGKQKCLRCFHIMVTKDLIGQNRLKGHCVDCRRVLLKGKAK